MKLNHQTSVNAIESVMSKLLTQCKQWQHEASIVINSNELVIYTTAVYIRVFQFYMYTTAVE